MNLKPVTSMKRFLHCFASAVLLILLAVPPAKASDPPGQIAVFPSMFELEIGKQPVNESVRLRNLKKTPVSIRVEIYNWTLDRNNNIVLLPPTAQSLDQWILINPVSFTVGPEKEQLVRFSIRPPIVPDPGEYRAIIYFIEESGEESQTAMTVLFKLGVGIYGYAMPVDEQGTLDKIVLDRQQGKIAATITNTGTRHTRFKGSYSFWKQGVFPGFKTIERFMQNPRINERPEGLLSYGTLDNTPVLPGTTRTIMTNCSSTENSTDLSSATLAIMGTLGGENIERLIK